MPNSQSISEVMAFAAALSLVGCAGSVTVSDLPSGEAAYSAIPANGVAVPAAYLIQPSDILDLRVFGEDEITNPKLRVDRAGNIQVLFVGEISAAGRSANDVQSEITTKLSSRYLVDPKVILSVAEPAPLFVSVEGEVARPGVYEMEGDYTLLSAIARAESTTSVAKLNSVIILRTVNGQQMAARFDLRDIRGGAAPDPLIRNNDVIVVGRSGSREALENFFRMGGIINGLFFAIR